MQRKPIQVDDSSQLIAALEEVHSHSLTLVLCDTNSLEHCWPILARSGKFGSAEILEIEPGEDSKSLDVINSLWEGLLHLNVNRNAALICLGGGVVTDIGGFVGATYKRGISTYHVPTSLLAMVDAAIGGKTGINLGGAKNQIGTFSPNIQSIIYPGFLDTLPAEHLTSGFAEMVKHAILDSEDHFRNLENIDQLGPSNLKSLVKESWLVKQRVVEQDFKEAGIRASLNLGHTLGHAIEALSYQSSSPLSHGHCVALGMLIENEILVRKQKLNSEDASRVSHLIRKFYSIDPLTQLSVAELEPFLKQDKKNIDAEIRIAAISKLGDYRGLESITTKEIAPAVEAVIA